MHLVFLSNNLSKYFSIRIQSIQ